MASNDQIILDHLLTERKLNIAPELKDSDFFELFVSEQILKNYDLSYDELEAGIVGRGNDGGIDSIYTFVNGHLVSDDTDFNYLKRDIRIDLIIIQSKTTTGFSENAIQRLISTTKDLLNLNNSLGEFETVYDSQLLRIVKNFRKTYFDLSTKFPELNVVYYYVTKGDHVHPNVERRVNSLRDAVIQIFSNSNVFFDFIDARKLLTIARQSPTETIPLRVAETPISTGLVASICLVRLKDYYDFITDSNHQLRRGIFEANVRDHQGSVEVNRAIRATLQEKNSEEDFWWLNNGITIVALEAPLAGKTLTIRDAQVVNGLQTSMEIYNYFQRQSNPNELTENRNILVRIIVPPNEDSRNRIIKATNSQTNIQPASLRATDEIQKDIEQFFETKTLFYDRRKNYHKNLGRPKDRVISIPYLAQAVMAIVLQEPNNSRGRPSSLIKDEEDYKRVFNDNYPISLYVQCAKLMKQVDSFLRDGAPVYISGNQSNVRFQLAMFASAIKANKIPILPADIANLDLTTIDSNFLTNCLHHVWQILEKLKETRDVDRDRIAKSQEFDDALKERLRHIIDGKYSL